MEGEVNEQSPGADRNWLAASGADRPKHVNSYTRGRTMNEKTQKRLNKISERKAAARATALQKIAAALKEYEEAVNPTPRQYEAFLADTESLICRIVDEYDHV
jgi:hypothetical protein